MHEVDILNRTPVIERLMAVLQGLRSNRQPMTFSLNGKWGSGKTFVLNLLANRIKEVNQTPSDDEMPFCYIRYDCWKYDYYAEPLISLVSAMQDAIQSKTTEGNIDYVGSELKDTAKKLCKWAIETGGSFVQAQTGINIASILLELVNDNPEKSQKEYDDYFSVTEALNNLRVIMKEVSQKHTLVIVVDELDRCLPEYMIRVLERLHHLFEGLENIIVIIATDRQQLEHTIKSIYGTETDAVSYLQKMIQFELSLDFGKIENEERLQQKFSRLLSFFDGNKYPSELPFVEFFDALFREIEIRKRIQWVDKICLVHQLSFGDRKVGYDVLYYELFWVVFAKIYNIAPITEEIRIDTRDPFAGFHQISDGQQGIQDIFFISYLKEKFNGISIAQDFNGWSDEEPRFLIYHVNDLNMMFWYWTQTTPNNICHYSPKTAESEIAERLKKEIPQNLDCIKKFQDIFDNVN